MKVNYFAGLAQHLVEQCGHPAIKSVESTEHPGMKVNFRGGGGVQMRFVRSSPDRGEDESLPERFTPTDLASCHETTHPVDGPTSLRVEEFEQVMKNLLASAGHNGITRVQTYKEWGKSGKPAGLRVECADGSEIFASFQRAWGPHGDQPSVPDYTIPEELL